MWFYILAYEPRTIVPPLQFEKYLENLHGRRLFDGVWMVRGNLSAHALVESSRAFLGDDAAIFAIEASDDYAVHGISNDLMRV